MGFVQDGRARGEKKGRKVNVSAGEGTICSAGPPAV